MKSNASTIALLGLLALMAVSVPSVRAEDETIHSKEGVGSGDEPAKAAVGEEEADEEFDFTDEDGFNSEEDGEAGPSDEELTQYFGELDKDKDGKVTLEEL